MADWRRLSERTGARPPEDVPYEGVPDHLRAPLAQWVAAQAQSRSTLQSLGVRLRLALDWSGRTGEMVVHRDPGARTALASLLAYCDADDNAWLDVMDALLAFDAPTWDRRQALGELLEQGGSAWRLRDDRRGLERRVHETVRDAVTAAAAAAPGSAGEHLRAAWAAAYGRAPDPVKSYSEAIKAVEAAAAPVVTPNNLKATLGTIRGQLGTEKARWRLVIPAPGAPSGGPVDPLIGLLSVLWEGQTSRHGGVLPTVPETPAAAQAAVHLAATAVQWFAAGAVQKVP